MTNEKRIDLHVHSTASDGSFTPTEVVTEAIKSGLAAIALTDHDTGAGIPEAQAAAKELSDDFFVIAGTELSCEYENPSLGIRPTELHILGYYIDPLQKDFIEITNLVVHRREERNRKMAENFTQAGIPMTIEELKGGNPDTIITRSHFARLLLEKGVIKKREEAFTRYLSKDSKFYVKRQFLTPEEAINTIKKAGGVPVLAHPLLYHLPEKKLPVVVEELKDMGIRGLEAIYTMNSGLDEGDMRALARKCGLFITGGSDFHGANKPTTGIGVGFGNLRIPMSLLDAIQQAR